MWGALAKIGGLILSTVGINYAVDAYNDKTAAAAADAKDANIGKYIMLAAVLFVGYKLLTKK